MCKLLVVQTIFLGNLCLDRGDDSAPDLVNPWNGMLMPLMHWDAAPSSSLVLHSFTTCSLAPLKLAPRRSASRRFASVKLIPSKDACLSGYGLTFKSLQLAMQACIWSFVICVDNRRHA